MTIQEAPVGSIARAARVLEALAVSPDGEQLADIVARTGFTKTTTHRVLSALLAVRYVAQDPEDRRYRLGGRLAELARRANRLDIAAMAARSMRRLAALTEDTVFLSTPEGAASICLAREVGAFPIRTLTLDRGDRRPLGVGAGALALYSAMPERRRAAIARANERWLAEYGVTPAKLEALRADTATRGYALNRGGVVPGMSALGLPVVTRSGRLVAALAIGAINERTTDARIVAELLPALRDETARLADGFSALEEEAVA